MDYLQKDPDPLGRGVKGVCTGAVAGDTLEMNAISRELSLDILKKFILINFLSHYLFFYACLNIKAEASEIPAVPELAWMSKNAFVNTAKTMAKMFNLSFMDSDADKLSSEFDKVILGK